MKFSYRRILFHILFILMLVSCFQLVIYIFPPEAGDLLNPSRLLILFFMCSIALLHNKLFNLYIVKERKWNIYLPFSFLLLAAGWGMLILLLPDSLKGRYIFGYLPYPILITIFFILAGLALNFIFLLLITKSEHFENQVIMKQMELDHLKNQLNPHFLFNSLNNVAATIQVDTELALNYIYTLSSLLRYQIECSGKESVTLAEENFFIESFLGIEELRLGERCKMSFESDIKNPATLLPPMLLQPFVEQAIKFGCSLSSRAEVKISVKESDQELNLLTEIKIPDNPTLKLADDVELKNAERRLKMFYHSYCRITTHQLNGFYTTSLFVDLKKLKHIS